MSWRNAVLGIEGESVDSHLAQFFGVKEGVRCDHENRLSAGIEFARDFRGIALFRPEETGQRYFDAGAQGNEPERLYRR